MKHCKTLLTHLLFGWILILNAYAQEQPRSASSKPNIVVLLFDDMGFSDLGCYGGEIETPNIDRLANAGLRYTRFYNAGRCWPTRTCMYTGYYEMQFQSAKDAANVVPPWIVGTPAMLRNLGYRTYHSGKWHIGGFDPKDAGFDEDTAGGNWNNHFSSPKHSSVLITDGILKSLEQHEKQHPGKPFYAAVDYLAPHFPLMAEEADIARYKDRYLMGWDKLRQTRAQRCKELGIVTHDPAPMDYGVKFGVIMGPVAEAYGDREPLDTQPWDSLSKEVQEYQAQKIAIHAAMVHQLDREVQRIVDKLKSMKQYENTVIFILSDNGADASLVVRGAGNNPNAKLGSSDSFLCLGPGWAAACNSPMRKHKCDQFEGGISTPLVVSWPGGKLPKGELRHNPGHVVDFLPTFLEIAGAQGDPLAGAPNRAPLPGKSLLPTFFKDHSVERDYFFYDHGEDAIVMGSWKLIKSKKSKDGWMLYDLRNDRGEIHDLAKKQPARVAAMIAKWQAVTKEFGGPLTRKKAPAHE